MSLSLIKEKLFNLFFSEYRDEIEKAKKINYEQKVDLKYVIEDMLSRNGVFNPQVTFDGKIEVEYGLHQRRKQELLPDLPDYISLKHTEIITKNLNLIVNG